jgi:hypothetical protein
MNKVRGEGRIFLGGVSTRLLIAATVGRSENLQKVPTTETLASYCVSALRKLKSLSLSARLKRSGTSRISKVRSKQTMPGMVAGYGTLLELPKTS